jgi:superoxide reductase
LARFGELIYTRESAAGPASGKAESHTPRVEAPSKARKGEPFRVTVRVGPHPNTPEHSIRRIEVWFSEDGRAFNPVRIASVELEPGYAEPEVAITVRLEKSGMLHVLAYCNLHGVWEADHRVEVEG